MCKFAGTHKGKVVVQCEELIDDSAYEPALETEDRVYFSPEAYVEFVENKMEELDGQRVTFVTPKSVYIGSCIFKI